jgi:hypothetical protein
VQQQSHSKQRPQLNCKLTRDTHFSDHEQDFEPNIHFLPQMNDLILQLWSNSRWTVWNHLEHGIIFRIVYCLAFYAGGFSVIPLSCMHATLCTEKVISLLNRATILARKMHSPQMEATAIRAATPVSSSARWHSAEESCFGGPL